MVGFEIDFLPVGTGEKSGDAIALRYGYDGNYKVMVVDGGTKDSGQELVNHIKKYYDTAYVDYVVNTHPDSDHASGLSVVLEQLEVGELWLHRPWEHSSEIRSLFKDGRITDSSLSERLKDALNYAYSLEKIAESKNISIKEPFQGSKIGDFTVLSPSKEWYNEIIAKFSKTPEEKPLELNSTLTEMFNRGKSIMESVKNFIDERWDVETLSESASTSYDNESGVVLYADFDGRGVLLTGDAGVLALNRSIDYAELCGVDLKKCKFIQIPHHGGRHNVTPSLLDRLIGLKVEEGSEVTKTAFVSASKGATSHPKKSVTNAFIRRGAKVIATKGQTKCHYRNMPDRDGWTSVESLPFYDKVEE